MYLPSGDQAGCWSLAGEVSELAGLAGALGPEKDLFLAFGLFAFEGGAVGKEGEGLAVGGPDRAGIRAAGGVGNGDGLVGTGVGGGGRGWREVEGGAFVAAFAPGDGCTIRRKGDAAGDVEGRAGGGLRSRADGQTQGAEAQEAQGKVHFGRLPPGRP